MLGSKLNRNLEIQSRVIKLQKELLEQKEKSSQQEDQEQNQWKEMFLQLIDIVDFVEHLEAIESNRYQKKIKKRLQNLLSDNDVLKMELPDGEVVPETTKVVGTKSTDDIPGGHVVEICRHGYLWKDTVVRPAEVIAACS